MFKTLLCCIDDQSSLTIPGTTVTFPIAGRLAVTLQWQPQCPSSRCIWSSMTTQGQLFYTACQLVECRHLNKSRLNGTMCILLSELGIAARLPTKRGCRFGSKPQRISTVSGHLPITRRATSETHISSQINGNLITVKLTSDSMNCAKLALLNARSVRNKTDLSLPS